MVFNINKMDWNSKLIIWILIIILSAIFIANPSVIIVIIIFLLTLLNKVRLQNWSKSIGKSFFAIFLVVFIVSIFFE